MFYSMRRLICEFVCNKSVQFYMFSVIMLTIQTYIFLKLVHMPYTYGIHTISLILLSDVLLLMLPYWLMPTCCRRMICPIVILLTIWQVSNVWYARTYMSLMPFSSYFLFENVNSLLVASITDSMRWVDMLLFCPCILVVIVYYGKYRLEILKDKKSKSHVVAVIAITVICVVISQSFFTYQQYSNRFPNRNNISFVESFVDVTSARIIERGYHRMDYYMMNGFIAYLFHYLSDLAPEHQLTTEELCKIDTFISKKKQYYDNYYAYGERNLIFIVVESLNSWVVDYEIKGEKVAPMLSMIFNDTTNFVVKDVVPQVCNGRSCDAHFIYNTGILPSREVVTAVTFGDVSYPSLAKALKRKGYKTIEIIGDEATFANQGITRLSYGFEELYDITYVEDYEELRKCEIDSVVFENAINILDSISSPFYVMIATLSMHVPFDKDLFSSAIIENVELDKESKGYLSLVNTFDRQLSKFIEQLKLRGLYEKSVIVIVGDHNGYDKNNLEKRDNVKLADWTIPMVIINPIYGGVHKNIVGQIDVYPTILDAIGANDYRWKGVGNSMFRFPEFNSVVAKDGELIGVADENVEQMLIEAWEISGLMIHSRYFDEYVID